MDSPGDIEIGPTGFWSDLYLEGGEFGHVWFVENCLILNHVRHGLSINN